MVFIWYISCVMERKFKVEILPEHVARAMGKNLKSIKNPLNPERKDVFCYKKASGGFAKVRFKDGETDLNKIGLKIAIKLPKGYQEIFSDRNVEFEVISTEDNISRIILKDTFVSKEISDFEFDIAWEKVEVKKGDEIETWLVSTHSVVEIDKSPISLMTNEFLLNQNWGLFVPYYFIKTLDFNITEDEKDLVFKLFNNPFLILSLQNDEFFKLIPYLRGMILRAMEEYDVAGEFLYKSLVEDLVKEKINNIMENGGEEDAEIQKQICFIISVMQNNTLSYNEKKIFSKWLDEKLMGDQIGLYGHIDDCIYDQSEEDE